MRVEQRSTKSKWSHIGNLRMPNATWKLGNAARWFEKQLGLPSGIVSFARPDGSKARSDKKLGALREEWIQYRGRR